MELIKCPVCGGMISPRATKCPHCGENYNKDVVQEYPVCFD